MPEYSLRPVRLLLVLAVLVLIVAGAWWYFTRPGPNPLSRYPVGGRALVGRFFSLVSSDRTHKIHQAFRLITWPQRKAQRKNRGRYWQRFGELYQYLAGLFGPSWGADVRIQRNKSIIPSAGGIHAGKWQYVVHVATETFHVRVQPQNNLRQPPLPGPTRYGLVAIREFSFSGGRRGRKARMVHSLLGVAGMGRAGENISAISAAYGGKIHEKPWQIKERLLPVVEHPHAAALRQCVYQLRPVRHDPTVRMVLKKIAADPRYTSDIRQDARQVLSGRVSKAILIGNGVVNTH